ncbi:MAG: hypothetical protein ACM3PS_16595 [Syntrophothermus sp.]
MNLLFALVLLAALVIAVDPQSRQKAVAAVRRWEPTLKQWNERVVVNVPSVSTPDRLSTPIPTATVVADDNEQIPVTGGDEDANRQPIVTINWKALGDAFREFWVSLSQVKINLTPKDNK